MKAKHAPYMQGRRPDCYPAHTATPTLTLVCMAIGKLVLVPSVWRLVAAKPVSLGPIDLLLIDYASGPTNAGEFWTDSVSSDLAGPCMPLAIHPEYV